MLYLTFDMEEWFDLIGLDVSKVSDDILDDRSADDAIISVMDELALRGHFATFYFVGKYAEKRPALVRRARDYGHRIGSHSYSHQDLRLFGSKKALRTELQKGIDVLEQLLGEKVVDFRAPGFSVDSTNNFVFEMLAELGIRRDSSLFVGNHSHGGVTGFPTNPFKIRGAGFEVDEFPVIPAGPTLWRHWNIAGGGYFRLAPYTLIQNALATTIANSSYFMCYFHPRDFASNIPRLKLSLSRYFRTYVGLTGMRRKFNTMLDDFCGEISNGDLVLPEDVIVVNVNGEILASQ